MWNTRRKNHEATDCTKNLYFFLSSWSFSKWGLNIIRPFSPGKGQCKFLLVRVDYFTKWIEVKPLAGITTQNVQNFIWKNIICLFCIPRVFIIDNSLQFIDRGLSEFYEGLGIKHVTISVEHSQTNREAEVGNRVILNELNKRLDTVKGKWIKELIEVLWAYRCTPQTSTLNTPYSLTYGIEAMIPIELGLPSLR